MNLVLRSVWLLLLRLMTTWYVLPVTAEHHNIEFCRCAAQFEEFYKMDNNHVPHHDQHESSKTTTSSKIQYPYNYSDYYINTDGYVIIEGIRVLSDRSTACTHDSNLPNDDGIVGTTNDDDDSILDDAGRGRYLMMGSSNPAADERHDDTMNRKMVVNDKSKQQQPRRALMGMMMMTGGSNKGMKHVNSVTTRYGGKGNGNSLRGDDRQRGKGEERNCAPDIPLPSIFICPTSAAAVTTTEPPTTVPIAVTTDYPSTQIETMAPTLSCVSSCDDNNICTIDTCDDTLGCSHTPVTCGDNEACDTVDGLCKNSDSLRPCVAVIDESDNFPYSTINAKWASFRSNYPTRPFCLLQPVDPYGADYLFFPTNPDFLSDPRVKYAAVNRDAGDAQFEMDWLSLCGYTNLANTGLEFISFFIDESGSMDRTTVAASLFKFISEISKANLTYCLVFDANEDWITPFDTVLGNVGGGGSCSAAP